MPWPVQPSLRQIRVVFLVMTGFLILRSRRLRAVLERIRSYSWLLATPAAGILAYLAIFVELRYLAGFAAIFMLMISVAMVEEHLPQATYVGWLLTVTALNAAGQIVTTRGRSPRPLRKSGFNCSSLLFMCIG